MRLGLRAREGIPVLLDPPSSVTRTLPCICRGSWVGESLPSLSQGNRPLPYTSQDLGSCLISFLPFPHGSIALASLLPSALRNA